MWLCIACIVCVWVICYYTYWMFRDYLYYKQGKLKKGKNEDED